MLDLGKFLDIGGNQFSNRVWRNLMLQSLDRDEEKKLQDIQI